MSLTLSLGVFLTLKTPTHKKLSKDAKYFIGKCLHLELITKRPLYGWPLRFRKWNSGFLTLLIEEKILRKTSTSFCFFLCNMWDYVGVTVVVIFLDNFSRFFAHDLVLEFRCYMCISMMSGGPFGGPFIIATSHPIPHHLDMKTG